MRNSTPSCFWFQTAFYSYVRINGQRQRQYVVAGTDEQRAEFKATGKTPRINSAQLAEFETFLDRVAGVIATEQVATTKEETLFGILATKYLAEGVKTTRTDFRVVKSYIENFANLFGKRQVCDIKAPDVDTWFRSNPGWKSAKSRNNALTAVKGVFLWAIDEGYIQVNPLRKREIEQYRTSRQSLVTDGDYIGIVTNAPPEFVEIFKFVYLTGCRPGEACKIEASMVRQRPSGSICVKLDQHKNAGAGKLRIIECSTDDDLEALVLQNCKKYPSGKIFRTPSGNPWTPQNLAQFVRQLRDDGIIREGITMYTMRHTSITEAVDAGGDYSEVAALHGTSPKMIRQNYLHDDADLIRDRMVARIRSRNA